MRAIMVCLKYEFFSDHLLVCNQNLSNAVLKNRRNVWASFRKLLVSGHLLNPKNSYHRHTVYKSWDSKYFSNVCIRTFFYLLIYFRIESF